MYEKNGESWMFYMFQKNTSKTCAFRRWKFSIVIFNFLKLIYLIIFVLIYEIFIINICTIFSHYLYAWQVGNFCLTKSNVNLLKVWLGIKNGNYECNTQLV